MAKTRRIGGKLSDQFIREQRRIAHYAVDRATTYAKNEQRNAIRGAGLGRLANAVGSTSSLAKRRTGTDNAWGAVFARGRDSRDNRGQGALLAYSQGASIYPTGGRKWLAFPTNAVPQRIQGKKTTPQRYMASGLAGSLGKLQFVKVKSRLAFLVIKNVEVSRRTGRARRVGARRSRAYDRQRQVVAFILIPFTARAARFNPKAIMLRASYKIPSYAGEAAQGIVRDKSGALPPAQLRL